MLTSAVFFVTSTVRPGKWAIHMVQDVPSYYVLLSCLVYSLYILAFNQALKRHPSATYLLSAAVLARLGMEITVPHTGAAIQMIYQFPAFRVVNFLAIYIALFATIIPLWVLVRLIATHRQLSQNKLS